MFVSNNQGTNNIYKYEDFDTETCVFENQFSITIGGSGRVVPKNYKGMLTADDEALAIGKYPTCAWSSDAFTNWLTQNSVNNAVSVGLTAGAIAGTIATGGASEPLLALALSSAPNDVVRENIQNRQNLANVQSGVGTGMSIASSIGNSLGQFYQASLLPNIRGGQATGDIIWACNRNIFTFRQMRVKTQFLRQIDNFFSRFGYKINDLKTPNITGRRYWNYIEIGNSEEIGYGETPSKYMEVINSACRKGVTIWHDHESIGNYNLSNNIL